MIGITKLEESREPITGSIITNGESTMKRVYKKKKYMLPDGNEITLDDIVLNSGCKRNTAHTRARKAQTLSEAYRPVNKGKAHKVRNSRDIFYGDFPDKLFKLMFGKWSD